MKRKIKKYLFDIKISLDSINEYLGEKRNFIEYDPNLKIENARLIVDTRNWVIHGYDKVDDVVIWGIISKHLPKLKKEIEDYLKTK